MAWQLVSALLLMLLVTSSCAQAANRFCGSRLSETLAIVCRGRGYYWEIEKRSPRNAGDSSQGPARQRRSVVQECCHRSCPISELESYCATSDSTDQSGGLLFGSLRGLARGRAGSGRSSSAAAAAAAAAAASRQRFTLGLLNKPFFFVTPRRTGELLDAGNKK